MYMHNHMSKEEIERRDNAISLYDGGWRAEDRDQMAEEYGMTPDEADKIAAILGEIAAAKVILDGQEVDFDACVELMDDDIREELHAKYAGEITNQQFLDMYCKAHREKYGEDFAV